MDQILCTFCNKVERNISFDVCFLNSICHTLKGKLLLNWD